MSRDPVPVIEEFLRDDEVRLRRNALTALGVIGGERSVGLLVRSALTDPQPEVRNQAVREIGALLQEDKGSSGEVLERLASAGRDPDAYLSSLGDEQTEPGEVRRRAARLLGEIRSTGESPAGALPIKQRLLVAVQQGTRYYPREERQSVRFRTRALRPGLVGGLVGAVLFAVFLAIARVPALEGVLVPLLLAGVITAPLFALCATQFATPAAPRRFDRAVGVPIELGAAAVGGLLFGIVVAALLLLDGWPPRYLVYHILLAVLLAVVVRLGTLMAYGLTNRVQTNQLVQVAVGGLLGLLVLTLVTAAVAGAPDGPPVATGDLDDLSTIAPPPTGRGVLARALWFGLLPACVALALAFASVDNETRPAAAELSGSRETGRQANSERRRALAAGPLFGSVGRLFAGGLLCSGVAVLLGLSVWFRGSAPESAELTHLAFDLVREDTLLVETTFPAQVDVEVQRGDTLSAVVLNHPTGAETRDYTLTLEEASGGKAETGDDPPFVHRSVVPGRYRLLVGQFSPSPYTPADVFAELAWRFVGEPGEPSGEGGFWLWVSNRPRSENNAWARASALEMAVEAVRLVSTAPDLGRIDPTTLNDACWFGSLYGFHREPHVIEACEAVVSQEPSAGHRDSRGLNRALNGQLSGAADDFLAFADDALAGPEERLSRSGWVAALRSGRNPFTPAVIDSLRTAFEEDSYEHVISYDPMMIETM